MNKLQKYICNLLTSRSSGRCSGRNLVVPEGFDKMRDDLSFPSNAPHRWNVLLCLTESVCEEIKQYS